MKNLIVVPARITIPKRIPPPGPALNLLNYLVFRGYLIFRGGKFSLPIEGEVQRGFVVDVKRRRCESSRRPWRLQLQDDDSPLRRPSRR